MLLQTTTKLATNNLSTVISSIMLRCQRLEVQKLGRYGHTPIFQCHQTYTEEACCQSFDVGSGMPSVSARFFESPSSTKTRYSARGCWLLDIVEVQEHSCTSTISGTQWPQAGYGTLSTGKANQADYYFS
jgi:hypothetical protein